MWRNRVAFVLGLLLLGGSRLFCQLATTQNDQLGALAYQQYGGSEIDSVNLATGTLLLHAPLVSYPQRGALKLDFKLLSDGAPLFVEKVFGSGDNAVTELLPNLAGSGAGTNGLYTPLRRCGERTSTELYGNRG